MDAASSLGELGLSCEDGVGCKLQSLLRADRHAQLPN